MLRLPMDWAWPSSALTVFAVGLLCGLAAPAGAIKPSRTAAQSRYRASPDKVTSVQRDCRGLTAALMARFDRLSSANSGSADARLAKVRVLARRATGNLVRRWLHQAQDRLADGAFASALSIAVDLWTDPLTRPDASIAAPRRLASSTRFKPNGKSIPSGMSRDQQRLTTALALTAITRALAEPTDLRQQASMGLQLARLDPDNSGDFARELRDRGRRLAAAPPLLDALDRPLTDPTLGRVRLPRVGYRSPSLHTVGELLQLPAADLLVDRSRPKRLAAQQGVFLLWEAMTVAANVVALMPGLAERTLDSLPLADQTRATLRAAGILTVGQLAAYPPNQLPHSKGIQDAFPTTWVRRPFYMEIHELWRSLLPLSQWSAKGTE